jgi:hypothetical protein
MTDSGDLDAAVVSASRPSHGGAAVAKPSRRTARWIHAGLALLLAAGLWRPLPRHGTDIPVERTDNALFSAVIERVARGEPFYASMGTELRARGYPSASVFNWRQPPLFVALARAPLVMRIVLVLLALGAIGGTAVLFLHPSAHNPRAADPGAHPSAHNPRAGDPGAQQRPEVLLVAVLAQTGAAMTALTPLGFTLPETWVGILVALSVVAYTRGHVLVGAAFGLTGFLLRDLVGPYVAVCIYLALRGRRRTELMFWAVGLCAWAVTYGIHAVAAMNAMQPGDLAHPSWVQFAGLPFVLATIGFGGWLYLMPPWAAAVASVLLVAAIWAPAKADHLKGTVATYLGFFAVVGQPFNQSWGLLTASTWAIAFGFGLQGLERLVRQAR